MGGSNIRKSSFILLGILLPISSSANRIFFWGGDHLVQGSEENPEYRDIPVIEGEKLVVTCWLKASDPDYEYRMRIYHSKTNSNTSGLIEDTIDGVKYVKEIINVNVDNAAAIDEKVILCELNKPTEETIKLTLKAFVIDRISVPEEVCSVCEGEVVLTLRRPGSQKKEGERFEEELKQKLKEKLGILETDIGINSTNGVVTAGVGLKTLISKLGDSVDISGCQCHETTKVRSEVDLETSQVMAEVDLEFCSSFCCQSGGVSHRRCQNCPECSLPTTTSSSPAREPEEEVETVTSPPHTLGL